jgi:hypothetical protein
VIGAARHAGTLADVSAEGLFVETDLRAARGTLLEVALRGMYRADLRLEARVAHRLVACADAGACEGLGLQVVGSPPDGFLALARGARVAQRGGRYRVCLRDPARETWSFELNAGSWLQAAELALASVGGTGFDEVVVERA